MTETNDAAKNRREKRREKRGGEGGGGWKACNHNIMIRLFFYKYKII